MRKFFLQLLFLIFAVANVLAQDNSRLRISLLTCTPGQELYSTFGHTGIRVIDSVAATDIVFNYGTFDFNDPDFYSKFVRGKLNYFVSTEYFEDFKQTYLFENRGITEQVLALKEAQKIKLINALVNNMRPENRSYKYDFTFDNCTTRARDIIIANAGGNYNLPAVMPLESTFRNAIHFYLDNNKHYWSKLGIDILLGSRMDKKMTSGQQQFLPDNLMNAFDGSSPKITEPRVEIVHQNKLFNQPNPIQPWMVFTLIAIVYFLIHFFGKEKWKFAGDRLLFFLTGLLGLFLVVFWMGTDHYMGKDNYNLLWANPLFFIGAFFFNSTKKWVKTLFLICAIILSICLPGWYFLPQQLHNALLPLVFLLLFKSFYYSNVINRVRK